MVEGRTLTKTERHYSEGRDKIISIFPTRDAPTSAEYKNPEGRTYRFTFCEPVRFCRFRQNKSLPSGRQKNEEVCGRIYGASGLD